MILLTFGNRSDWSRNVRAAGGLLERASFRMLGIRQFMRRHVVPAESRP